MSRYYKNYDEEKGHSDNGWGRQEGESDEDYQERLEDWNDYLEFNDD